MSRAEERQLRGLGVAAERIYRSRREAASLSSRLVVEDGAQACWLPQETIVFEGGRLSRRRWPPISSPRRTGCRSGKWLIRRSE